MNRIICLSKNIYLFLSLVFLLIILLFSNQTVSASSSIHLEDPHSIVIECLRLRVPTKYREAWLIAERRSWGPWLENKEGFLGRQLFWDGQREEATLLISWSNRKYWKEIPKQEIDSVQKLFEKFAREETGQQLGNPFPIKFEGELSLQ